MARRPLKERIGNRIAEILKNKGWKQQDLADKTGMGKAYISRIVNGHVNLEADTIDFLESALGVPIVRTENMNDDFMRKVAKSSLGQVKRSSA